MNAFESTERKVTATFMAFMAIGFLAMRSDAQSLPIFMAHEKTVDVGHNKPSLVRRELLDPDVLLTIGRACFSDKTISQFKVVSNSVSGEVELEGDILSDAFRALYVRLENYRSQRLAGHTQKYVLICFSNQTSAVSTSDPDFRLLLKEEPGLPASWLKKLRTGSYTNKAGATTTRSALFVTNGTRALVQTAHVPKADEIRRWTEYALVDGEVAWVYKLDFHPDGTLDYLSTTAFDAKELDPKYEKIITAAGKEAEAEMKEQEIGERFRSIHTYWSLQKKKLATQGIEWRSPRELNPHTIFD